MPIVYPEHFQPPHLAFLSSLAALPSLTLAQAQSIKDLLGPNCYLDPKEIKFIASIAPTVWVTRPITRPERRGAKVNPNSLTQRQPWLAEGISRGQWYARQRIKDTLTLYLGQLPIEIQVAEGLKLHNCLRRLSLAYSLPFGELWSGVAGVLRGMGVKAVTPPTPLLTIEEQLRTVKE